MALGNYSGQIDLAFLIVALSIVFVVVLHYFLFQVPGIILLILGIAAIIVGILKILSAIYY
jgi:hypothetical protein